MTKNDPVHHPPFNLSRVITLTKIGTVQCSSYKDGMFKHDGTKDWTSPKEIRWWVSIPEFRREVELKNQQP